MRNPRIPMIPEALPHQGTYIPVSLPRRPELFEIAIDLGGRDLPVEARLKTTPRKAGYLFQAEWAWSPDHNRISSYYLHRGRRYWSLFCRRFDDNWGSAGNGPRSLGFPWPRPVNARPPFGWSLRSSRSSAPSTSRSGTGSLRPVCSTSQT